METSFTLPSIVKQKKNALRRKRKSVNDSSIIQFNSINPLNLWSSRYCRFHRRRHRWLRLDLNRLGGAQWKAEPRVRDRFSQILLWLLSVCPSRQQRGWLSVQHRATRFFSFLRCPSVPFAPGWCVNRSFGRSDFISLPASVRCLSRMVWESGPTNFRTMFFLRKIYGVVFWK